jgi:hypothetical protein
MAATTGQQWPHQYPTAHQDAVALDPLRLEHLFVLEVVGGALAVVSNAASQAYLPSLVGTAPVAEAKRQARQRRMRCLRGAGGVRVLLSEAGHASTPPSVPDRPLASTNTPYD